MEKEDAKNKKRRRGRGSSNASQKKEEKVINWPLGRTGMRE